MYRYDEFDAEFVRQRVAQFRDQVERRVSGELTEDEFKPLRLMNGLYLQLHAYMLRIAVPYGTLSSRQIRKLAHIARTYDRGYGHFTTRQNLQFNWPALSDVPDILAELAEVEMHAIQTSGNCIRNVTADHFAGATAEEVADPRPYAEIIRQWSSLHPEFSFLPRKFKVAVTAAQHDRAAIQVHDIGLHVKRLADGGLGFAVWVGGGQGRTPLLAKKIRDDLPEADLLSYLEAVLRIYNLHGRRDNKYRARIKILVKELTPDVFRTQVEADRAALENLRLCLTAAGCELSDVIKVNGYLVDLDHFPVYNEIYREFLSRCGTIHLTLVEGSAQDILEGLQSVAANREHLPDRGVGEVGQLDLRGCSANGECVLDRVELGRRGNAVEAEAGHLVVR
jgi:sulfite reductase (NADPH) hemoprotein beta-component